eukprot:2741967-Alexandrium_andersonii.AAC.1
MMTRRPSKRTGLRLMPRWLQRCLRRVTGTAKANHRSGESPMVRVGRAPRQSHQRRHGGRGKFVA